MTISIKLKTLKKLLRLTSKEWVKHNPLLIGAAISFYIIMSLGPILAILVFILGEIFSKQATAGQIVSEIQNVVGEKPAHILQNIIQRASASSLKTMAIISSIPLLFFGTTMVFFQLRNALNIIWDIKPGKRNLRSEIKNYSFSFVMLAVIGFLLLCLMLKSPVLSFIKGYIESIISMPPFLIRTIDILISYILLTILFAAVYKILIKTEIRWKDIWVGSAVTSFLFSIVQVLVGLNAGNSGIDSALGAIGSFTILFLWIFYSSLIFLFGACFTKVYSANAKLAAKK